MVYLKRLPIVNDLISLDYNILFFSFSLSFNNQLQNFNQVVIVIQ